MKKITIRSMMSAIALWSGVLAGCTDDEPATAPVPGVIASGQDSPGAVILDENNVYWVNTATGSHGSVMRLPKTGGEPQALASEQSFPLGLVVDDEAVYWTDMGIRNGEGKVMRVAKAGGTPVELVAGLDGPGRLAADEDHLYWTIRSKGVMRVAKSGGEPEVLVPASALSAGIAVDARSVYFMDVSAGEIRSIPKAGGDVATVASVPQADLSYLETDGENVYWHNGGVDSLWQVKATGGTPSVLFPASQELRHFVVTPDKVFIALLGQPEGTPPGPSSIIELDRASGNSRSITPAAAGNWGVAVDEQTVYWTNNSSGTVNAVAR
jgi:hypothetical protein